VPLKKETRARELARVFYFLKSYVIEFNSLIDGMKPALSS